MHEIELKFQVPAARRAAVDAAVAGRTSSPARTRLQAAYYDTADRDLAAAGLALRIRREGRAWVQTLKGAAADGMTRLEHNVSLGRSAAAPNIDPHRHAGTPAGDALLALLERLPQAPADSSSHEPSEERRPGALAALYRTDILRRTRILRATGGRVELAFDVGSIRAAPKVVLDRVGKGGAVPEQPDVPAAEPQIDTHVDVRELEIELVAGSPFAVIDTARRWVHRFGLWLDTRSKAERGDLLARGLTIAPVRLAMPIKLGSEAHAAAAWQAVVRSCADQIIVNASQIASGEHSEEHVHQLRVGLRRLRSAISLFDGSLDAPIETSLNDAAADLFRQLGGSRDLAVIEGEFAAELVAAMRIAGIKAQAPTPPSGADETSPSELVRQNASQMLLLDLLAAGQVVDSNREAFDQHQPVRDRLAHRLNSWHRQLTSEAKRFAELDDEARHRLRKRAKRLRYAVEFCSSLFERRKVRRYLRKLRALQERLGALSDVVMAMQAFARTPLDTSPIASPNGEAHAPTDPHAMFALGWLAARREVLIKAAAPELKAFVEVKRFWK